MIDYPHFARGATRTESVIQSVSMPKGRLMALLNLAVMTSSILDLAKKEIFYGKAMDGDIVRALSAGVRDQLTAINAKSVADDVPSVEGRRMTRVLHGAIGSFTESGELIEALLKALGGGELDAVNIAEELGDTEWYHAIMCDELAIDKENAMRRVIAKLKARYPEKFTQDAAENRNLTAERAILEDKEFGRDVEEPR